MTVVNERHGCLAGRDLNGGHWVRILLLVVMCLITMGVRMTVRVGPAADRI
jgi:hypothetical protein